MSAMSATSVEVLLAHPRRESASRPQSFCAQRCWASVTGHHGHHGHHGIKHGGIWRCNALLTWILKLKWILEHVLHGTIYRIYRQRAQLELGRHSVSRILKINCNNDQFQILVISCSNLFRRKPLATNKFTWQSRSRKSCRFRKHHCLGEAFSKLFLCRCSTAVPRPSRQITGIHCQAPPKWVTLERPSAGLDCPCRVDVNSCLKGYPCLSQIHCLPIIWIICILLIH